MIHTHIPASLIEPYKEVLKSLTQWNISKQPKFWSEERIDGEMMYKIHRHSSRIVEETGLSIQQIIYDQHKDIKKIFPAYYQIIKIKGKIKPAIFSEDMFCQTFTYLNGKYENMTFVVKDEKDYVEDFAENTYAFAIIWQLNQNPTTPKWFARPYHRMFM